MKVKIINKGKDGDSLCFKVKDSQGKEYIIDDCKIKNTFGLFEGYFGSYKGYPAHLNILSEDNVELLINNENLSQM